MAEGRGRTSRAPGAANPEAQLASYFAEYEPAVARLGKALRAKLRRRLPGYVYVGRNALVISYSPTGQGYGGVCSLWLDPGEAKLYFARGAQLAKADPNRLLQGRAGVRHVVMNAAADFDRPEIEVLIAAALELAKVRLDTGAQGGVIIRAEAQKQRASRAKRTARSRSPRTSRG